MGSRKLCSNEGYDINRTAPQLQWWSPSSADTIFLLRLASTTSISAQEPRPFVPGAPCSWPRLQIKLFVIYCLIFGQYAPHCSAAAGHYRAHPSVGRGALRFLYESHSPGSILTTLLLNRMARQSVKLNRDACNRVAAAIYSAR